MLTPEQRAFCRHCIASADNAIPYSEISQMLDDLDAKDKLIADQRTLLDLCCDAPLKLEIVTQERDRLRELLKPHKAEESPLFDRVVELLREDPTEHCATGCDWCHEWSDKACAILREVDAAKGATNGNGD